MHSIAYAAGRSNLQALKSNNHSLYIFCLHPLYASLRTFALTFNMVCLCYNQFAVVRFYYRIKQLFTRITAIVCLFFSFILFFSYFYAVIFQLQTVLTHFRTYKHKKLFLKVGTSTKILTTTAKPIKRYVLFSFSLLFGVIRTLSCGRIFVPYAKSHQQQL